MHTRTPALRIAAVSPAPGEKACPVLVPELVGRCESFQEAIDLVQLYAPWDAPLLVVGETGTGKELVARSVHQCSPRRHRPFIAVNCATLPDTLIESELFGHVRGAFTDASQNRQGLVRLAEGGTLFLDEVEALAPRGQGVLLRFLQDLSYRALGADQLHHANVRIVSTSNVDLRVQADAHQFRDALLYRLDAFRIPLAPLRARMEDLELLVVHLLAKAARQTNGIARTLSADGLALLRGYHWPGNIRQLEHVLLKAHVVCQGPQVGTAELRRSTPELAAAATDGAAPPATQNPLRAVKRAAADLAERQLVADALLSTRGNISAAARFLGMQRACLSRLVKKYGIKPRSPEGM